MLKYVRTGLVVGALLSLSVGVAVADPVSLPEVARSADPDLDGWHVTAKLSDMSVNAVPNLAATAFTREGFVTATATLTIDGGSAASADIASAKLQLWFQLGCQIDVTGGMSIGDTSSSAGEIISGKVDNSGAASSSATPGGRVDPGFLARLKPGDVETKETNVGELRFPDKKNANPGGGEQERPVLAGDDVIALRSLKEGGQLVRVIHVQDYHAKRDGCAGSVFIRFHARATMSTFRSDNDVDVYSDIVSL